MTVSQKPVKFTKEQLDVLIDQTVMFKNYFSNMESCSEIGRDSLMLFPFMPIGHIEEQFDSAIEQANIYKNYFTMTETYLKMIRSNLDMWHSMYIDKKPKKKK